MQSLLIDNNIVLNFDKETENSEIDLKTKEGDELILKQRDIFRRKSSSGSTTISKPEEISELFSCPDSWKIIIIFRDIIIIIFILIRIKEILIKYLIIIRQP